MENEAAKKCTILMQENDMSLRLIKLKSSRINFEYICKWKLKLDDVTVEVMLVLVLDVGSIT